MTTMDDADVYKLATLLYSAVGLSQAERRLVVQHVLRSVWVLNTDEAGLVLMFAGAMLASKPGVNLKTTSDWIRGVRNKRQELGKLQASEES